MREGAMADYTRIKPSNTSTQSFNNLTEIPYHHVTLDDRHTDKQTFSYQLKFSFARTKIDCHHQR